MLVHICCSVDSHFFLQKLREDYPDEKLIGFFYDPNIHPYAEYRLRLMDVARSCKKLGVELIEGPYDFERWMNAVKGLENEPEKGDRCAVCFDRRFEVSAQKANEIGEKSMTTTLLVSPKKSQDQLVNTAKRFEKEYGVKFVYVDYRANGGTQIQSKVSKDEKLYRQDYCGCMFGLNIQRDQQNMIADELFSPINAQILPGSIEERLMMYEKRMELEERGVPYTIVRQKFLNFRLRFGWVKQKKKILCSYILPFSIMKRRYTNGRVEMIHNNIGYFNREEIRLISLKTYNKMGNFNYSCVKDLIFDPPSVDMDMKIRKKIGFDGFDLSPIVVLEKIPEGKLEFFIDSEQYRDVREHLVLL